MQLSSLALAIGLSTVGVEAYASSDILMLDIKPQPLETTLNLIATQANMTLVFDPKLVDSLTAPQLQGPATVRDVLMQVLNNTGIEATIDGNTIILKKLSNSQSATELSALSVVGSYIAPGMFDEASVESQDLPYLKTSSNVQLNSGYIEQFRGTSAGDMLKGIPGVEVGEARNGGAIDVNIRGVQGQNRVPVVVDGSIQSTTVYRGYAGIADRSYIDPDLISTVSIDKGPTNSAQGMGAVGGVVVMETLKSDDILRNGQQHGVRIKGGMQSNSIDAQSDFDATPRNDAPDLVTSDGEFINIAYATAQEGFDLVVAASHRDIGNYFAGNDGRERYFYDEEVSDWKQIDGEWVEKKRIVINEGIARFYKSGEEVLNTSNKNTSVLVKPTFHINDDSSLELSYQKYKAVYGEIMASQIFRNTGDTLKQWKSSEQDIDTYSARYKYTSPDNPLLKNLKVNLWHTSTDSKAYNGSVFSNPREGNERPPTHDCESCVDVLYLAKTESLRTGFDISNQSILQGTDYGVISFDYGYSFQKESIGPGSDVQYSQEDIDTNRFHRDGDRYESSVFLQTKWSPVDWLSFEAGGRYSWFRVQENNDYREEDVRRFKEIFLLKQSDETLERIGHVRWLPDENGDYTDANDPRVTGVGTVNLGELGSVDISEVDYNLAFLGFETQESLGTYTVYPGASRKQNGFAPNFAVNMQLSESWLAYARYSEALRMPSIMESTRGWSVSRNILDIRPEHAKNKEIGFSFISDDLFTGLTMRAKVAYFDNKIEDYITRHTISDDNLSATDIGLAMGNTDSFNTKGFEFQSRFEVGGFYADLSATYYTEAELCDAEVAQTFRDNPYANRQGDIPDCSKTGFSGMYVANHIPPQKSVAAILGVKFLDDSLDIGTRITYTGKPDTDYDSKLSWQNYHGSAPHVPTVAYTLIDAYINYKITDNMDVNFNIANLTNEFYLDALALSLIAGPGRTSQLTFTARF
ncbi:TonB-dependent receptor [Pseudoalteromonas neustonica]|uniref:TonB-dependent receptor n=1 Tax=Pseudoalteromonas neustonica TaxID=1840331 RepID=A0ABU9U770_9GAMM